MYYKSIVHIILLVIVMIIIMKWNEWMTYVKRTAFSFWLRFLSGDERLSKLQFRNDDDYDDSWSLSFISPKKLNGYAFFFKNSIQSRKLFSCCIYFLLRALCLLELARVWVNPSHSNNQKRLCYIFCGSTNNLFLSFRCTFSKDNIPNSCTY